MRKLMIAIGAIAVISVFAFFMYLKIYGDPYAYADLEESVTAYLTESEGYAPEEIQQITVEHVPMKRPGYYAEVIFTDEPDVAYLYCDEQGRVVLCGEREVAVDGEERGGGERDG